MSWNTNSRWGRFCGFSAVNPEGPSPVLRVHTSLCVKWLIEKERNRLCFQPVLHVGSRDVSVTVVLTFLGPMVLRRLTRLCLLTCGLSSPYSCFLLPSEQRRTQSLPAASCSLPPFPPCSVVLNVNLKML